MGMETPRFLSGKLLLAMPGIGDPRFASEPAHVRLSRQNHPWGFRRKP